MRAWEKGPLEARHHGPGRQAPALQRIGSQSSLGSHVTANWSQQSSAWDDDDAAVGVGSPGFGAQARPVLGVGVDSGFSSSSSSRTSLPTALMKRKYTVALSSTGSASSAGSTSTRTSSSSSRSGFGLADKLMSFLSWTVRKGRKRRRRSSDDSAGVATPSPDGAPLLHSLPVPLAPAPSPALTPAASPPVSRPAQTPPFAAQAQAPQAQAPQAQALQAQAAPPQAAPPQAAQAQAAQAQAAQAQALQAQAAPPQAAQAQAAQAQAAQAQAAPPQAAQAQAAQAQAAQAQRAHPPPTGVFVPRSSTGPASHSQPSFSLPPPPRAPLSERLPPKLRLPRCVRAPGRGLVNWGNTCFANAVLQALAYSTRLRPVLVAAYEAHERDEWCAAGECELCLLAGVVSALFGPRAGLGAGPGAGVDAGPVAPPPQLLRCIAGYTPVNGLVRQQDAHEYLHLFLDRVGSRDKTRRFNEIFRGTFQTVCTCTVCRSQSRTKEPFQDMSVDISAAAVGSIDEALGRFAAPEVLQAENSYACSACGVPVRAYKFTSPAVLPSVLVVHVKRFENSQRKIDKHVRFDRYLNVASQGARRVQRVATLFAVVVHRGAASQGHYYCYVRVDENGENGEDGEDGEDSEEEAGGNREGGGRARVGEGAYWIRLSDALATRCSWAQVQRDQAYMLMYDVGAAVEVPGPGPAMGREHHVVDVDDGDVSDDDVHFVESEPKATRGPGEPELEILHI